MFSTGFPGPDTRLFLKNGGNNFKLISCVFDWFSRSGYTSFFENGGNNFKLIFCVFDWFSRSGYTSFFEKWGK